MGNLLATFRALFPADPLLVGEVLSHEPDGTSVLRLPGGGSARVRGTTVPIGSMAFYRTGAIEGPAPTLPTYAVEV